MKKILLIASCIAAFAAVSCTKEQDPHADYAAGKCIASNFLASSKGSMSVLVQTEGVWRLSCDQPWISFDVKGGSGRQAFTVMYDSNDSDITSLKSTRKADVVIYLDNSMVADTLQLIQQGFNTRTFTTNVAEDPSIQIEFDTQAVTTKTLVCCSIEGADSSAVVSWARNNADVAVVGQTVYGSIEGLNIRGCDYAGLDSLEEHLAFRELISSTVNKSAEGGADWILCGQMYHLSMMQMSYPGTPSWYPEDADDFLFESDRHAWQNNMYDVVWMKKQGYVTTYTDNDGHSYAADYVYVSSSVLGQVNAVELLSPVAGMRHKAIKLTLKY